MQPLQWTVLCKCNDISEVFLPEVVPLCNTLRMTVEAGIIFVSQAQAPQLPSAQQLVDGAVSIARSSTGGGVVFPLGSLMVTLCSHENGKDRAHVISRLLHHLEGEGQGAALEHKSDAELFAVVHLITVVVTDNVAAREAAVKAGVYLH